MHIQPPPTSQRIFGLDFLRAFAILSVLIGHGAYLLPQDWAKISWLFAFDGVGIFFVLSGFLVGYTFIEKLILSSISYRMLATFWLKRALRTLPNYYFTLLLLMLLGLFFKEGFTLWSIHRFFFFTQNIWQSPSLWFFPESWSLAVEEWFYLLFPLSAFVFAKVLKLPPKTILLLVILMFISGCFMVRWYRFMHATEVTLPIWDSNFRKQVVTQLDSIMFGVLGAYLAIFHTHHWRKHAKLLFSIGCVLFLIRKYVLFEFIPLTHLFGTVFSFPMVSISVLLMLPLLSQWKPEGGFIVRQITWVSLISYSLYLVHLSLVQTWILSALPFPENHQNLSYLPFLKYALYWCLSLGLALLQYRCIEQPAMLLREKWLHHLSRNKEN
jgi:peptidoglycan/LPS O-acetylase OafA/YrhL